MKLLPLCVTYLLLGCSTIIEIARTPDVKIVSEKETITHADSDKIHDTTLNSSEYYRFSLRDDIEIIDAAYWVSDNYHTVKYRYLEGVVSGYGYKIKIQNSGKDTAFNVYAYINTDDGEKVLINNEFMVPGEYDSASGTFGKGARAIGTASVKFDSYP